MDRTETLETETVEMGTLDKFVKGKRVTLPSGKHAKELKKVYRSKEKANKYMAAIMIGKGG